MGEITDKELYFCQDCRVWDPENQPSVMQKLDRNPDYYADRIVVTVQTPMSLNFGTGPSIPLYTDILVCKRHETEMKENKPAPLAPHGGCNWSGCRECFPKYPL